MREAYGITTFCDDIRYERGGKHTYVGVYNQTMNVVGTPPLLLPMLHFAINLMIPSDCGANELVYKIFKEKLDSNVDEVILDLPPQKLKLAGATEKYQRHVTHLNVSPLIIDSNFTLKVRAYLDGHERRLGVLHIRIVSDSEQNLADQSTNPLASVAHKSLKIKQDPPPPRKNGD